jgi:hypothetical protein
LAEKILIAGWTRDQTQEGEIVIENMNSWVEQGPEIGGRDYHRKYE